MKFEKRNKCKIVALDDYLVMTNDEPIWEDDVFELTPQMCKDIHELLSDGYVGSSEASVEYLYPKDNYDLVVDSSFKTSEIIAEEIIAWMN